MRPARDKDSILIRSARLRRLGAAIAALALPLAAAAPAAASGGGNVSVTWQLPGALGQPLTNVTFPITVNPATDHQYGLFFAQQFAFHNSGMVAYTGLQPQPDPAPGVERLRALFSVFGAGTSTGDPNCAPGADGGQGTSCAIVFPGVYGHTYNLTVQNAGGDTWYATAIDTVTGIGYHIGSWTLPPNSGGINPGQAGFVEYYLYNSIPSCAQNPVADVVFGAPTSTGLGGLLGSVTAPTEYSSCVGQSNFASQSLLGLNGQHIVRGFTTTGVFASAASGRCLTAPASAAYQVTQLIIQDCAGASSQSWTFSPDSPASSAAPAPTTPLGANGVIQGTLRLGFNTTSGGPLCLDNDNNTAASTPAIVYPCSANNTNQQWYLYPDGTVRALNSGLCLDVYGGATGNGTPIDQWPCSTGAGNQRWTR